MDEITQQNPQFPQFDLVYDTSDHHFAIKQSKPATALSGSAQKKIAQEWKLLSKDLPDSIYVRAYETRVDLLRAAIVGARGTPYHDGLFFFDISFPSDYPAHPPLVHFLSFGYRVNPNLYNNGRVCLSLLNTWFGKKSQKWDPNNSTVLQVLLSIQALVLNENPYFNEPGYSSMAGKSYGKKKSLAYSEDVFLLSCKIMLLVLKKPPKNFEPLVTEHFKDHGEFILNACDMYRKGVVTVGMFNGVIREGGNGAVSTSFKTASDLRFGDLVMAIAKTGAPVERFVEEVRIERERKVIAAAAAAAAAAAKKKAKTDAGSVRKSVVNKLKRIFKGMTTLKRKQKSKTSPVSDGPLPLLVE